MTVVSITTLQAYAVFMLRTVRWVHLNNYEDSVGCYFVLLACYVFAVKKYYNVIDLLVTFCQRWILFLIRMRYFFPKFFQMLLISTLAIFQIVEGGPVVYLVVKQKESRFALMVARRGKEK